MKRDWPAKYYTGESATETQVVVALNPEGISVAGPGIQDLWRYSDVKLTQGYYAGEVVRLDRGAEILVIPDRSFLQNAQSFAPHLHQKTADPNSARSLTVLYGSALLVLAAFLLAIWAARPWLESAVAELVPVSVEDSLGAAAFEAYAPPGKSCTDAELNHEVRAVLDRLVAASGQNRYKFQIRVVDDGTVNALAAPGGYIVVFSGLLRLTHSPDELAGILAHEVQHVLQRHSTKGMVRMAGIYALLAALTGDLSNVLAVAGQLGSLSFARSDEEQADREGMRLIQAARLDADAMVRVYRKLENDRVAMPGGLRYLSTHPDTGDRVEMLGSMAAASRYGRQPFPSEPRWRQIAVRCR